jgi:hypothetical protein
MIEIRQLWSATQICSARPRYRARPTDFKKINQNT